MDPFSGLPARGFFVALPSISLMTLGKLSVSGDVKITGCSGGDGLGGNGGDSSGVGIAGTACPRQEVTFVPH